MLKRKRKIEVVLLIICVLMIVTGSYEVLDEGIKPNIIDFLNQIRTLVPFLIFPVMFLNKLFSEKAFKK